MEPAESTTDYEFQNITILSAGSVVLVDGRRVRLTSMEFDLLMLFAANAGVTLPRQDILKALRDIDADLVTRSVDVLVSRLRQKLNDSGRTRQFIETVWGSGYRFIAEHC